MQSNVKRLQGSIEIGKVPFASLPPAAAVRVQVELFTSQAQMLILLNVFEFGIGSIKEALFSLLFE